MTKSPQPIPMPSFRELFVGMLFLVVVGGFAITRGGSSLRFESVDANATAAGISKTPGGSMGSPEASGSYTGAPESIAEIDRVVNAGMFDPHD